MHNKLRLFILLAFILKLEVGFTNNILNGVWYGTVDYSKYDDISITKLEIDTKKNTCLIQFADIYNSVIKYDFSQKNDTIFLANKQSLIGYTFYDDAFEHLVFNSNENTLFGEYVAFDRVIGDVTFRKEEDLENEKLESYIKYIEQKEAFYGVYEKLEYVPKNEHENLIQKIKPLNKLDNKQQLVMYGALGVEGLTFGYEYYLKLPQQYMYTMKLGDSDMSMAGQNKAYSWEYDGFEKLATKDETEEDIWNEFLYHPVLKYTQLGAKVESIRKARIGNQEGYEFELKDPDWPIPYFYFLSKKDMRVIRAFEDAEVSHINSYHTTNGINFPSDVNVFSNDFDGTFKIDSVVLKDIDDSVFLMPKEYELLVREEKESANDLNDKGNEAYDKEDYELAIEYYSKANELEPNDWIILRNRAYAYMYSEDYYKALVDLDDASKISPDNAELINLIGRCKYFLKDYDNAILEYKKALKADSTYNIARANLFSLLISLEYYDESLPVVNKIIELGTDSTAYYLRGQVYYNLERYPEAIEDFEKSGKLKYTPKYYGNFLGNSYFRIKEWDKAKEQYLNQLEVTPEEPIQVSNLAYVHYELAEFNEAVDYMLKAIELDYDELEDAYKTLMESYFQLELFEKSIEYADKCLEINPADAYYYDNKAFCKQQLQDFEGAHADFTKSITLYPDDPEIYYYRGLLSIHLTNSHDGCADLKTALEMGFEQAKEEIEEKCGDYLD